MELSAPPPAILIGIRNAKTVKDVDILGEPTYDEKENKWVIKIILDTALGDKPFVPKLSEWFILIDSSYPLGSINIFPSKNNGLTATFQHQDLNLPGFVDSPWRTGKMCHITPLRKLGMIIGDPEPVADCEERLKWNVQRALDWVRAAGNGSLIEMGDPFELPYCPNIGGKLIVHDESNTSLHNWDIIHPGDWGIVVWDSIPNIENAVMAVGFMTRNGEIIRTTRKYDVTQHGSENNKRRMGIWWLWPSPIVLKPWQIPTTWEEIRVAGRTIGIEVDNCLREIAKMIRGKDINIMVMGYPIPTRYGQEINEIHWQAIRLPKLEKVPPKGFRPNEMNWWHRDKNGAFAGNNGLEYIPTENWHPERMQARGRLKQTLRDARIALVGCGALGSVIAELLVRGGVSDIMLIDHDILEAMNLVRHTLSGQEIGKNKAVALAQKLATTAPFAIITPLNKPIPVVREEIEILIDDREIVIDCTGTDDVLYAFSLGWWSLSRLFISASVGYEAIKIFIFAHRGHSFPQEKMRSKIEPILQEEREKWSIKGETLEGAGCWSPLFPARLDDLFLAGASCIKIIEELVDEYIIEERLITLEQNNESYFSGLYRHEIPSDNPEHME